jgi:hypothetical protein
MPKSPKDSLGESIGKKVRIIAPLLASVLSGLSCASQKKAIDPSTLSINGYSVTESNLPGSENDTINVQTIVNGNEVELVCPMRERCRTLFNRKDNLGIEEKRVFSDCVDWEAGCKNSTASGAEQ